MMGAANKEARALALELARKHFDGIAVWPSDDKETDTPYWQALKNVRRGLYAAGYHPHVTTNATVRALSTIRKERKHQEVVTTLDEALEALQEAPAA